jgi:hypothetical protein
LTTQAICAGAVSLVRTQGQRREGHRHGDDLVFLGNGRDGQLRCAAHRADDEFDLVVEDQAIDGRNGLVGLVFVVVGDDLHLVLLAAYLEPALGIHVVRRQLGAVLDRLAPRGAGPRQTAHRADLQYLLRMRAARRQHQRARRHPSHLHDLGSFFSSC